MRNLALHAGRSALGQRFDFWQLRHGGITREGGQQGTVSPTQAQCLFWLFACKHAIDQTCGKSVTTADTVDATLASRYHERFGDHAVSISKKVKYLSTGEWTSDSTLPIHLDD
jgi:hypothetical protein